MCPINTFYFCLPQDETVKCCKNMSLVTYYHLKTGGDDNKIMEYCFSVELLI